MVRKLKTLKGSVIQRSPRFNVGKEIGGKIYCHMKYKFDAIPASKIMSAAILLDLHEHDFSEYNVISYDSNKNSISFIQCPDFDSATEPVVGSYVSIDLNTRRIHEGYSNAIYHHKWLFVKDDYAGFDIDASYQWSKYWLDRLPEKADGTNKERWINQLKKYDIV